QLQSAAQQRQLCGQYYRLFRRALGSGSLGARRSRARALHLRRGRGGERRGEKSRGRGQDGKLARFLKQARARNGQSAEARAGAAIFPRPRRAGLFAGGGEMIPARIMRGLPLTLSLSREGRG